jgi:phosphohistidine phosphatase SixA
MLVGHNPDVMEAVEGLTGDLLEDFPTSATAVIDFRTDSWSQVPGTKGILRKLFIPREFKQ